MSIRNVALAFSLASVLILSGCAHKQAPSESVLPESFVPAGYEVMKKAEGDLNNDGQNDVALALKHTSENEAADDERIDYETTYPPRLLLVLFKTSSGFREVASSSKLLLCKNCGGVFGHPFKDIMVDDGDLIVEHYGGSSDRWGYAHVFHFRDGDMYLVKLTETQDNINTGEGVTTVTDYITGAVWEETLDVKGRSMVKEKKIQVKPLQRLSEVEIGL